MELIERAGFLDALQTQFEHITEGEGHCVFISGEAGIGKTSLVKAFAKEHKKDCYIYLGSCDALFTPRPLAPLYDIAWQMEEELLGTVSDTTNRAVLFTRFLQALSRHDKPVLIVFEDIHWADEATLDFIKFLGRRIAHIPCLFILTYRDNDIDPHHPLRHVMGQLPADGCTRLQLQPLSRQAVVQLAHERGYDGEEVYSITGGNPFYVSEILASYSAGIPDNIKDSILSVHNRHEEATKDAWQILSILPTGIEIKYLDKINASLLPAIEECMGAQILVVKDDRLVFKHELYRRTIEEALSPLLRIALHKRILELFREIFEQNQETERIIHHAKNANEYDLVVHYAPLAAQQAALVGAHREACKLYYTAIEYYQGNNANVLIRFYEAYAYECYLINQIREAIIYQGKALALRQQQGDAENTGNCMRFLSRLWWFDGHRRQAESLATQAIELLNDQPASPAKAMAFSNMAQLKMLADQSAACIHWGEKAIEMARELGEEEILAHALNNVGTVQMCLPATRQQGIALLQQSLSIALKNGYHEHAARAYNNLGSSSIKGKEYVFAREMLETGIRYCEERDLHSWIAYMLFLQARLLLETGHWSEARRMADRLLADEGQPVIVRIGAQVIVATIMLRKGEGNVLPLLLDVRTKAFETVELQRIIPVLAVLLEYECLTGEVVVEQQWLDLTISMIQQMGTVEENSAFAFWLLKARDQQLPLREWYAGYQMHNGTAAAKAAAHWQRVGCPYEQALALFEGNEAHKRDALSIMQKLGATATYEKMKLVMRIAGIKSIPRGIRKSTQCNPALLTTRELDVLQLLKEGMQNKEIAAKLYISAKTVDHHISSILFKLDVASRIKAVQQAVDQGILK